ncbi:Ig-specific serine endopeptidase MIP [Mycoplasmoides gallisepticum]|uniref:Ig-specific serine endopeptidase MIP n=1 Tax=Mycoplasmoides gallisepticum TaxID=2096 RepID=UPI003306820A
MKLKFKHLFLGSVLLLTGLTPLMVACAKKQIDDKINPTTPSDEEKRASDKHGGLVEVQPEGPSINLPGTNPTNPTIPTNIPGKPQLAIDNIEAYRKLSTTEKNKVDLEGYVNALSRLHGGLENVQNVISQRYNIPALNETQIRTYNQKAEAANQPDYASALLRNFSIVNDNNYLYVNPIRDSSKAAYWNSTPGNRGLPRYLPNEIYKKAAMQTYAIEFFNRNSELEKIPKGSSKAYLTYRGTAWILDYELDSNGYPTKWYLATNAHVAAGFMKAKSDGSRFTNIVDLKAEKERFEKAQKTFDDGQTKWEGISKNYLDKIERLHADVKRYHGLKQQAETDGNVAKVSEYENLIKKIQDKDLPAAYQEKDSKTLEEWNKLSLEYRKAWSDSQETLKAGFLGETTSIVISHFNQNTPLNQWLRTNAVAPTVEKFTFKPEQVKLVYAGVDFLNSSPKDYIDPSSPISQIEESADFAVLEIDFNHPSGVNDTYKYTTRNTLQPTSDQENVVKNARELAKIATSDYANWEKKDQISFISKSLKATYEEDQKAIINDVTLTNGQKRNAKKANLNFISVGFPISSTDNHLEKTYDTDVDRLEEDSQSLWINKPIYIAEGKENGIIGTKEYGGSLNPALSIRNFLNMPGITDFTISNPLIQAEKNVGYVYNFIKDTRSNYQGNQYTNYGLGYSLNSWQPLGGASGSSVRTIDNKLIGINFATADGAGVSLTAFTQAFRSEGESYSGFYGKYQLEEYDLIYGGGKKQRTSYREALKSLKPNIKTALFPNGINEIPEEFKFKNQ